MADDGPVIEEVLDDVDSDDDDMPALNGAEGAKDAATEDVLDDDEVRARADVTGMRMDRDRDGTCLSTPNNVGRPGSEQRAAGRRPAVRRNRLLRRAAAPGEPSTACATAAACSCPRPPAVIRVK